MYNECCPIWTKSFSVKDQLDPWINTQIKSIIKRTEKKFKLFKINIITRTKFTFVRTKVTSIIRNSKQSYYQNLFNKLKINSKQTWQAINKIVNFKCPSKRTIKELVFNNQSYTDNYDKWTLLNEHLTSLLINIQNSMHCTSAFTHYSNYLTNVSPLSCFFLFPVCALDVQKIIEGFKKQKLSYKYIHC